MAEGFLAEEFNGDEHTYCIGIEPWGIARIRGDIRYHEENHGLCTSIRTGEIYDAATSSLQTRKLKVAHSVACDGDEVGRGPVVS